ncbi:MULTISPECIES: hypothetical protein [Bradyrhizobium]|uniref:hypothetical protein n=1 Tax=Bradyrhizobium TaxID=374 RepID=UPI001EDA38F5|nr:hypothetical protein [Bradyrhizobium zhengyangense]MCG2645662.1 hypothetical protein [Bradyrhizobium zhengyangense]
MRAAGASSSQIAPRAKAAIFSYRRRYCADPGTIFDEVIGQQTFPALQLSCQRGQRFVQKIASRQPECPKEIVLSLIVSRYLDFITRLHGLRENAIIVGANRLILGRSFNDWSTGRRWTPASCLLSFGRRGRTTTNSEVTISMESHYLGWTPTDDAQFRRMVENGASENEIALALSRTPQQLRRRGYDLGLPLKWFRAVGLSERSPLRR